MKKIEKQTVCIATEETKKEGYSVPEGFIGKLGYFFTPEQLNEYTESVIKQTLDTAAENADTIEEVSYGVDEIYSYRVVDPKSITNTFEDTYNKLKV